MRIKLNLSTPVIRTPRVLQLEGLFDLPPSKRSDVTQDAILPLDQQPWQIGLIVGPSGCGKSTLARELFGDRLISGYEWPADQSIVDAFPVGMPIADITGLLCSVGFSSPPSWLRPYRCLSNGEQFRVTLARALADPEPLIAIDEFTSVVDRTVAQIASHAVAKAVRKSKIRKFVAVSCHDDIIDWLQPDWIYQPALSSFQWRLVQSRPPVELEIVRCHRQAH